MPTTARSPEEFASRFWSKVDKGPDCWLWKGALTKAGYGNLKHRQKVLAAHRVSIELSRGALDPSETVLHRCDTPACVRPDHLLVGSQRENIADCTTKRRNRREGTKVAKLSANQVRKIRIRYERGETQRALATEFGLSQTAISHLVQRRTWRWVD